MFLQTRSAGTPHADRLLTWTSPSPTRRRDIISRAARLSVDQFPHGLLILGEEATIVIANHQAELVFGYNAGEMTGLPINFLLTEQAQIVHADLWAEFRKAPESRRLGADRTVGGVRRDGVIVPLEIGLSVLVEDDSRYMVASIVDITERRNLEARIDAATQ